MSFRAVNDEIVEACVRIELIAMLQLLRCTHTAADKPLSWCVAMAAVFDGGGGDTICSQLLNSIEPANWPLWPLFLASPRNGMTSQLGDKPRQDRAGDSVAERRCHFAD